jgi:hypothetical protein
MVRSGGKALADRGRLGLTLRVGSEKDSKLKKRLYSHQKKLSVAHVSPDCIEELVKCIGKFNKSEIDADTSFKAESVMVIFK